MKKENESIEDGKLLKLQFSPALHRDGTRAPDLIDVILQEVNSDSNLFLGSMDKKAWRETQRYKRVVLYSKSRKKLWHKGKTSGNELEVIEVYVNCEQTTLLIKVFPLGRGVCHTKDKKGNFRQSCFYRKINNGKLIFMV